MEELQFVHVELKRDTWANPKMSVRDPFDAVEAARALIEDLDREMVINIHMATDGRVINATICSLGAQNSASISPIEVLRTAIVSGAHSIIMLHNHPSGSCQPSKEDLNMAKKIATVCNLVGLELKDFIVIGAYGYRHSVKNKNLSGLNPVISGCKRYDMKNQEIIAKAAIKIGLLTVEEAERRLRNREDIPLHTIQGWRLRGNYKVKDDAEPIEVKLWKKQDNGKFYLAKAYLYSKEQVLKE